MKELSIEEKAKRYDEAIEKLRSLHDNYDTVSTLIDIKEELEDIFPELAESKDEKIRKHIIKVLKSLAPCHWDGDEGKKCIAWLEKQGQDGKVWFYRDDYVRDKKQAYQDGIDNVLNNPQKYGLEKREIKEHDVCDTCDEKASCVNPCPTKLIGEQKPAWSEEEEKLINSVIELIDNGALDRDEKDYFIEKLKSLKDRVQPQPKQEWSEEDEDMLYKAIAVINRLCAEGKEYVWSINTLKKLFYWLKSLKDRFTWKPSDEQMEAMQKALVDLCGKDEHNTITGLYYDLKKLKAL